MNAGPLQNLSRRERQVMNALYADAPATVGQVLALIPDPPSYSSIRATLRVLVEKGQVEHEVDGRRYLYRPTLTPETAQHAALTELVGTFFGGSPEQAAAALLGMSDQLTETQIQRLTVQVAKAREEGR